MIKRLLNKEIQTGLLALSPFFLVATSLAVGVYVGLLALTVLFLMTLILFPIRNLISSQQRLVIILVISSAVILILRMLLNAEAYDVADKIGLFLPLIMLNSLVLSTSEKIFTMPDFKSVFTNIISIGIVILFFFIMVGFSRDLFNYFSIINSPAACFILTGFLFAVISFLQGDKLEA